jgi:hypothetical protein
MKMDRLYRFYLSSISIFVGIRINLRTAGFKKREQERESDPPKIPVLYNLPILME